MYKLGYYFLFKYYKVFRRKMNRESLRVYKGEFKVEEGGIKVRRKEE